MLRKLYNYFFKKSVRRGIFSYCSTDNFEIWCREIGIEGNQELVELTKKAWEASWLSTVEPYVFNFDNLSRVEDWDYRFIMLARHISSWSKDPSTQTGAVIVDANRRVVSVGYNGFARGVRDTEERLNNRELKYKMICHCERNAILFSQRDLSGCTLYTYPFMSCTTCASMVIQSGIKRCVAPPIPDRLMDRWAEDMAISEQMFRESGVELVILK